MYPATSCGRLNGSLAALAGACPPPVQCVCWRPSGPAWARGVAATLSGDATRRRGIISLDVDAVGLAAAIGGSVVGLAGVAATAFASWNQGRQATALAEQQHEHELKMARGERVFATRA